MKKPKVHNKFWDNEESCKKLDNNMKNKPSVLKILDELLDNNTTVLEVGCGPGHYMKHYEDRVKEMTGLDYSAPMLEIASQSCNKSTLVEGSCWELPFEDNSIDVVFQVDGKRVYDNLVFSQGALPRTKSAFQAMGLKTKGDYEPNPDDILGKTCKVTIEHEEYESEQGTKTRCKIPWEGYIVDNRSKKNNALIGEVNQDEVPF